jgi:ribonuclease E
MTRKRIGTGLLEAFGEECEHCKGRGVIVHDHPVDTNGRASGEETRGRRGRGGGRSRGRSGGDTAPAPEPVKPSPMALAGTKPHPEPVVPADDEPDVWVTDTADTGPNGPVEPVEPVRSGRSGRSSRRSGDAGSADAPIEVTWAVVGPIEGTPPTGEESGDRAAEEPVAPVVVTSTRRRRAGRPAGPPVAVPEPDAETPDAEIPDGQADAAAPAPGDHDRDAAVVAPTESPEDGEEQGPSLVHVPVKKKGSRKR